MYQVLGVKCFIKRATKYIDIGTLALSIGQDVCQALPGLHSFTGCDTVSAFAGRGRLTALKTV